MEDGLFFTADTSDLGQPFSDAFVTFHISRDGFEGSNVVPYLPKEWFDVNEMYYSNFSRIWFKNFVLDASNPPYPKGHNYFHIIGASDHQSAYGKTSYEYDFTYIFEKAIETDCIGQEANCNRRATDHEIGHQFNTNACTNLEDCDSAGRYHGKHDYRGWWLYEGGDCHSENRCLMFPGITNPAETFNRFCKEDLILGDPNCSGQPGERDGAIRTRQDPE